MSNWTHVAGIIRVDDLRLGEDLDFEDLIGREILYESPFEEWENIDKYPERYLPTGSEGSLQMSVWTNPDKSDLAAYTVSIFGDLRDHDNAQEVVDWFKKTCEKFLVRNAVIVVENERNGQISWTYGS
jgi:hypothetical protein